MCRGGDPRTLTCVKGRRERGSYIGRVNPLASPLLTDLYQLTMLQAYYEQEMTDTAVFELFVRKLPPKRDFLVAAGLAGRFLYAHVPRSIEGSELELQDLRRRLAAREEELRLCGLGAALAALGSIPAPANRFLHNRRTKRWVCRARTGNGRQSFRIPESRR